MKALALLIAVTYGAAAIPTCSTCHLKQTQSANAMSRAMESIADCHILRANPQLTFQDGPYSYRLQRAGNETYYTVAGPGGELTVKLLWALGQGAAGQTYVYQRNGNFYESRVSYFKEKQGLDLTIGANNFGPANLEEAAGRVMSAKDSAECIGCHATNSAFQGVLHPESTIPGVQCARCHEGTSQHAGNNGKGATPVKLGALSTEEMSNFCGQCHRSWEQIAAEGPRNINNVRFQPYRLTNSKCYDAADPRIRCTACHDPHSAVSTQPAAYDSKCQACHSAAASQQVSVKSCKVGTHDCTSCHMPKYELPGAHHKFTDHWIRTVKANAPYPS